MEIVAAPAPHLQFLDNCFMSKPIAVKFASPLLIHLRTPAAFRLFAAATTSAATAVAIPEITQIPEPVTTETVSNGRRKSVTRVGKMGLDSHQLKLNWLESLSCPSPESWSSRVGERTDFSDASSGWVLGVDPDLSGAMAVLKPDDTAEVFDSPVVKVPVGKRVRKRLDAKSIVMLLRNIGAPTGSTVYIEQSIPFPQDGKQGWWSGGFGYGLWIGVLVASGYSVVPVPSFLWKGEFKLVGNRSCKDDSRELATVLFPSLSPLFKRKKITAEPKRCLLLHMEKE